MIELKMMSHYMTKGLSVGKRYRVDRYSNSGLANGDDWFNITIRDMGGSHITYYCESNRPQFNRVTRNIHITDAKKLIGDGYWQRK